MKNLTKTLVAGAALVFSASAFASYYGNFHTTDNYGGSSDQLTVCGILCAPIITGPSGTQDVAYNVIAADLGFKSTGTMTIKLNNTVIGTAHVDLVNPKNITFSLGAAAPNDMAITVNTSGAGTSSSPYNTQVHVFKK